MGVCELGGAERNTPGIWVGEMGTIRLTPACSLRRPPPPWPCEGLPAGGGRQIGDLNLESLLAELTANPCQLMSGLGCGGKLAKCLEILQNCPLNGLRTRDAGDEYGSGPTVMGAAYL